MTERGSVFRPLPGTPLKHSPLETLVRGLGDGGGKGGGGGGVAVGGGGGGETGRWEIMYNVQCIVHHLLLSPTI